MKKFNYSNEIANVVKQFLDEDDWHYSFYLSGTVASEDFFKNTQYNHLRFYFGKSSS